MSCWGLTMTKASDRAAERVLKRRHRTPTYCRCGSTTRPAIGFTRLESGETDEIKRCRDCGQVGIIRHSGFADGKYQVIKKWED